jgi:hypothetical protein
MLLNKNNSYLQRESYKTHEQKREQSCSLDTVYTTTWHINKIQLLVLTQQSIQHNTIHATTWIRRIKNLQDQDYNEVLQIQI